MACAGWGVEIFDLGEEFAGYGALAGDDVAVVGRVDKVAPDGGADARRRRLARRVRRRAQRNGCAVARHGSALRRGRRLRHDDVRGAARRLGRERKRLGVIARRVRDEGRAGRREECGVGRSADLKRAGPLQNLALEEELPPRTRIEVRTRQHRRTMHVRRDAQRRRRHASRRDAVARRQRRRRRSRPAQTQARAPPRQAEPHRRRAADHQQEDDSIEHHVVDCRAAVAPD
mmetsp:Transcript_32550/g.112585  ORF Transcript_32550/g.112585 Transcript_32550/m.112585 type:complete len:231 (-) Transcript_32550:16-708(-)